MSGAAMMVWARPPTRSRASSTMTERPESFSAWAAPRPAAPAPMMATSTSEGRDMMHLTVVIPVSAPNRRRPGIHTPDGGYAIPGSR